MKIEQFFSNVLTICDWDKLGNDDDVLKPLIVYLAKQPDDEIFSFDDIMAELLYDLDTRKIFEKACREYPHSDDSFLYSRCVALTNGTEYYRKVKAGRIKKLWTMEFEAILSVPSSAWGIKYNKDPADYPHSTPLSYETGSNKKGWK